MERLVEMARMLGLIPEAVAVGAAVVATALFRSPLALLALEAKAVLGGFKFHG